MHACITTHPLAALPLSSGPPPSLPRDRAPSPSLTHSPIARQTLEVVNNKEPPRRSSSSVVVRVGVSLGGAGTAKTSPAAGTMAFRGEVCPSAVAVRNLTCLTLVFDRRFLQMQTVQKVGGIVAEDKNFVYQMRVKLITAAILPVPCCRWRRPPSRGIAYLSGLWTPNLVFGRRPAVCLLSPLLPPTSWSGCCSAWSWLADGRIDFFQQHLNH